MGFLIQLGVKAAQGLAGGLANWVLQKFFGGKANDPLYKSIQALAIDSSNFTARLANAVVYLFLNQGERQNAGIGALWRGGRGTVDAQHHTNDALYSITDKYVPSAIHFIEGRIYYYAITPLREEVHGDEAHIGALESFQRSTDGWRYNTVDPVIGDWRRFNGWLGGSDDFSKERLPYNNAKGWIKYLADLFSDVNHVSGLLLARWKDSNDNWRVGPMIEWLYNHRDPLDDFLTLLIDYSPDRYRHIITAGEAILNSPYP